MFTQPNFSTICQSKDPFATLNSLYQGVTMQQDKPKQTEQMQNDFNAEILDRFHRINIEMNNLFNALLNQKKQINNEASEKISKERQALLSTYRDCCFALKEYFLDNQELGLVLDYLIGCLSNFENPNTLLTGEPGLTKEKIIKRIKSKLQDWSN